MSFQLPGDEAVCTYCGEAKLTGSDDEEHVLPRAINARLVTRSVCTECNRWAGKHIDQPWLRDPLVADARYWHCIPDRQGRLLDKDPFLAGETEDGTRLEASRDGSVRALNSRIVAGPKPGSFEITAPDQKTLDKLLERQRAKAIAAGKTFKVGEARHIMSQPKITGRGKINPGQWERMAAKAVLGLLGEKLPPAWRRSPSADGLRTRMRRLNRPASHVSLHDTAAFARFAPRPCSAVAVRNYDGQTVAVVSLMGTVGLTWELVETIPGIDLVWVSDPVDPAASTIGRLDEVVARRCAE